MSKKARLKAIETKNRPVTLQAKLPTWLQDDSYTEPVATGKVITPSGYLTLQKDGSILWHD
ncbi:hypothetical protein ACFL2N_02140 [Pseudomonadota bacterium]